MSICQMHHTYVTNIVWFSGLNLLQMNSIM